MFLTVLGQAAGKSAAKEGMRVLRELAGIQDEQARILAAMDVKLDALIESPFRDGRSRLQAALVESREADDRLVLLREARGLFMTALAQDKAPLSRSFAALHLAAVWVALGQPEDVRAALERAHAEALRAAHIALRGSLESSARAFFPPGADVMLARMHAAGNPILRHANDLARVRFEWIGGPLAVLSREAASIPVFVPTGIWQGRLPVPDPRLLPQFGPGGGEQITGVDQLGDWLRRYDARTAMTY